MLNNSQANLRLRTTLNRTFSQEARSRSSLKSRQVDELRRLKNICFPHKDSKKVNQTIDYYNTHSRDELTPPPQGNRGNYYHPNQSLFIEKTQNSLMKMPENSSFAIGRGSYVSFNMSPLSGKQDQSVFEHEEKDHSGFFDVDKSNILDQTHKNFDPSISVMLRPSQQEKDLLINHEEDEQPSAGTLYTLTHHFSTEMTRFVSALTSSMKSICLTKLSEKNLQLLLNKYLARLESVQSQWHKHLNSNFFFFFC